MDWNLYWTIIWQVVLASLIVPLPLAFGLGVIVGAVRAANGRRIPAVHQHVHQSPEKVI